MSINASLSIAIKVSPLPVRRLSIALILLRSNSDSSTTNKMESLVVVVLLVRAYDALGELMLF